MKKTLKEKVYETVSTLRKLFAKIKINGERNLDEIIILTKKINMLETELRI